MLNLGCEVEIKGKVYVMLKELVQLTFDKIMQTRAYTMIVLGAEGKRFAIYTDPSIGKTLQMYLTDIERVRPLTHDLINSIFKGLDIRIKQVVINEVIEAIYFARLFIEIEKEGLRHIIEIDARPSDCITIALMNNVPVFCTREVLEKAIAVSD